jgi:hypothetical protein
LFLKVSKKALKGGTLRTAAFRADDASTSSPPVAFSPVSVKPNSSALIPPVVRP